MACKTVGPKDLKIGMHIQLDSGSNLVMDRSQVGGGDGGILRLQKQMTQKSNEFFLIFFF